MHSILARSYTVLSTSACTVYVDDICTGIDEQEILATIWKHLSKQWQCDNNPVQKQSVQLHSQLSRAKN